MLESSPSQAPEMTTCFVAVAPGVGKRTLFSRLLVTLARPEPDQAPSTVRPGVSNASRPFANFHPKNRVERPTIVPETSRNRQKIFHNQRDSRDSAQDQAAVTNAVGSSTIGHGVASLVRVASNYRAQPGGKTAGSVARVFRTEMGFGSQQRVGTTMGLS
jgi:hypothetical protein